MGSKTLFAAGGASASECAPHRGPVRDAHLPEPSHNGLAPVEEAGDILLMGEGRPRGELYLRLRRRARTKEYGQEGGGEK